MKELSFIDQHCFPHTSHPEKIWSALIDVIRRLMRESCAFTKLMGCEPTEASASFSGSVGDSIPGFQVVESETNRKLKLRGRHRFAEYQLAFTIDDRTFCAESLGNFPGLRGQIYKTFVIRSGGHVLITQRLLRTILKKATSAIER